MFEVRQSETFVQWLTGLRDTNARIRIAARLRRVEMGNLGDVKSVGSGVSELRVNYGPGYRLYFVRHGQAVIILLCGGDKSSQSRDIVKAKQLANEL